MKKKLVLTVLIVTLAITFVSTLLLPHVKATDVKIVSISPVTRLGKVGEKVRIGGTINTTAGLYKILFDNIEVNKTTAIGNKVDVTFQVPFLPEGNYTITLQDDLTKNNATIWFQIEPAYYIVPEPLEEHKQFQQDDSVVLHVNVTGGKRNTVYYANITVELPYPVNTSYSAIVELNDTADTGYGYANIKYPNKTLFQPSDSHTNFTGLYHVFFNKTLDLAENSFFIGLTNASNYHREEFVEIRAVDYQPNEAVNISITFLGTNKTYDPLMVNASQQGIINATWKVPWNASIGNYNVSISSKATTKPIADSQLFIVPGYKIDVYARNLAGDPVSQILVKALDYATITTHNATSEENGLARLSLEKGNHTLEAFWNGVKVNDTQMTITGVDEFNLTCELTNMGITVKDKNGIRIPFADLNISYQYVTTKEKKVENGSVVGETDPSGVFFLKSMLPNITYTINASRYERVFNINNNTVENLPAEEWFNLTILCPAKTLTLNIKEHHRNPLPNARVEVIEQMGGLFYNKTTDNVGLAVINCTFGNYTVKVYMGNVFLNETLVEMFNDTVVEICCKLYNLTFSVKIVDYFGQPIPNANVTLPRDDLQSSSLTQSDGTVTFSDIIGGNLPVMVYLPGQSDPCSVTTPYIDESKTIEIKIWKYVIIAGFLVETSQLTTAIIIAAGALLILSIEIYRKKRLKPKQSSD